MNDYQEKLVLESVLLVKWLVTAVLSWPFRNSALFVLQMLIVDDYPPACSREGEKIISILAME